MQTLIKINTSLTYLFMGISLLDFLFLTTCGNMHILRIWRRGNKITTEQNIIFLVILLTHRSSNRHLDKKTVDVHFNVWGIHFLICRCLLINNYFQNQWRCLATISITMCKILCSIHRYKFLNSQWNGKKKGQTDTHLVMRLCRVRCVRHWRRIRRVQKKA